MKNNMFSVLFVVLLAGCSASNNFYNSATNFLTNKEFENKDKIESIANPAPMAAWWEQFNDPFITDNIKTLMRDNLDIQQASERVLQSRERYIASGGQLVPTLSLDGSARRSFANNTVTNTRLYTNTYEVGFGTSWQLDIFGKLRNARKSSEFALQASIFDKEAVQHALIAEFVQKNIIIGIYQDRLRVIQSNLDNRQKIYDLVRNRYNSGLNNISQSDVYLAQQNLDRIRADAASFERLIQAEIYNLDVLLGRMPGTTSSLTTSYSRTPPRFDQPLCQPLSLLDRRPDLKAAQSRLNASDKDINVAIADLYPSLSIAGFIGFNGNNTSNLLDGNQLVGSLLAQITARLFEGGQLRSNIRLQESEAREQALAYSELILNAVREVETALNNANLYRDQLSFQKKSVQSLQKAENLSRNRYIAGLDDLQDYLNIQQNRYNAMLQLHQVYQDMWINRVNLYLALGGDWFNDDNVGACDANG